MINYDLSQFLGKVVIVTQPFGYPQDEARQRRPLRLAAVIAPLALEVFIVTGNFHITIPYGNVRVVNVKLPMVRRAKQSIVWRLFRFICAQFALSFALIRLIQSRDNIDIVFFFGAETFVVPVITCKLLKRHIVLVLRGSLERETRMQGTPFSNLLNYLKRISLSVADSISLYSESLIWQWDLKKYEDKIIIVPSVWVDTNRFRNTEPLHTREKVIGYVGRVDVVRGVFNIALALPTLLKYMPDVKVLIVGDGQSCEEIEQYLQSECLVEQVKFTGWVNHDDIPYYLNRLKLLVLPSYSEGLPTRALEAMACGTPVLATPVGSIPEIIRDGETGFIMKDNSPECIARNILRAMNHPNVEQIAQNARALIEQEYRYDVLVDRFRRVLAELH